jgi:hypothetical protein
LKGSHGSEVCLDFCLSNYLVNGRGNGRGFGHVGCPAENIGMIQSLSNVVNYRDDARRDDGCSGDICREALD